MTFRLESGCDLCQEGSPVYNFEAACCRTRFLIEAPDKITRKAWLAIWRSKYGDEAIDETKEMLTLYALGRSSGTP